MKRKDRKNNQIAIYIAVLALLIALSGNVVAAAIWQHAAAGFSEFRGHQLWTASIALLVFIASIITLTYKAKKLE